MVDPDIIERSINDVSTSMTDLMREKEPNITHAEIEDAARNFIEFIRILREMDAEQKAKET